jgi:hypothetical protein
LTIFIFVREFRPKQFHKIDSSCLIQYQYVEVTHACIQVLFAVLGLALGSYLAHYVSTIIMPERRKSGGDSSSGSNNRTMYSIELSPHTAETALNRDDPDPQARAAGSLAVQMTPRRVKRRSHTRNSTRSAGKVQANKHRSSTRSTRSLGLAGGPRGLNPVTRLMERSVTLWNQTNDSSSMNEDAERYDVLPNPTAGGGLVNRGFESSRPNSLYSAVTGAARSSVSNQVSSITDCESVSRPPSALTSYSNFHGQRKPALNPRPHGDPFASLTQESLTSHATRPLAASRGPLPNPFQSKPLTQDSNKSSGVESAAGGQLPPYSSNASYDDLPPPPPPLSSSPTEELLSRPESDSAQDTSPNAPVPQQRNNPRRNQERIL